MHLGNLIFLFEARVDKTPVSVSLFSVGIEKLYKVQHVIQLVEEIFWLYENMTLLQGPYKPVDCYWSSFLVFVCLFCFVAIVVFNKQLFFQTLLDEILPLVVCFPSWNPNKLCQLKIFLSVNFNKENFNYVKQVEFEHVLQKKGGNADKQNNLYSTLYTVVCDLFAFVLWEKYFIVGVASEFKLYIVSWCFCFP